MSLAEILYELLEKEDIIIKDNKEAIAQRIHEMILQEKELDDNI